MKFKPKRGFWYLHTWFYSIISHFLFCLILVKLDIAFLVMMLVCFVFQFQTIISLSPLVGYHHNKLHRPIVDTEVMNEGKEKKKKTHYGVILCWISCISIAHRHPNFNKVKINKEFTVNLNQIMIRMNYYDHSNSLTATYM